MKATLIATISALLLWSFGAGRLDNSKPENSCHLPTPEEGAPRPSPYLAAVQLWPPNGGCIHLCTATIDTVNSVLTTSSCVAFPDMYLKYLRVVAAVSGDEKTQQVQSVEWVDLHHLSDPSEQNVTYNIARVVTSENWHGFKYVRPASIDEIGISENRICKYSGWDWPKSVSEPVSYFEKDVRYIGDDECKKAIKYREPFERNLIRECIKEIPAHSEENNHKPFYVYGGPLICNTHGVDFMVGFASYPNFTSDGNLTGLPIFTEGLDRKMP